MSAREPDHSLLYALGQAETGTKMSGSDAQGGDGGPGNGRFGPSSAIRRSCFSDLRMPVISESRNQWAVPYVDIFDT